MKYSWGRWGCLLICLSLDQSGGLTKTNISTHTAKKQGELWQQGCQSNGWNWKLVSVLINLSLKCQKTVKNHLNSPSCHLEIACFVRPTVQNPKILAMVSFLLYFKADEVPPKDVELLHFYLQTVCAVRMYRSLTFCLWPLGQHMTLTKKQYFPVVLWPASHTNLLQSDTCLHLSNHSLLFFQLWLWIPLVPD